MLTVAYLANQFPSDVEPYVVEEIGELRRRGLRVVTGSVRKRRTKIKKKLDEPGPADIVILGDLRLSLVLRALWLFVSRWGRVADLIRRVLFEGKENPIQRLKALVHGGLGAYYAAQLQALEIDHIHVHHGYFGSSIAMVAARLLQVGFSMTLHGSDLLLHKTYLDTKLDSCRFCLTVSEFNRRHVFQHYSGVKPDKMLVARLGVALSSGFSQIVRRPEAFRPRSPVGLQLLAVGRLHRVKDHAFLIRACAQLQAGGVDFRCSIAGEGPERDKLASLIRKLELQDRVTLLGHIPRHQMKSLYARADVTVLTSRSEGIPVVLMEAMSQGKIVLAPAITGIPEIIVPGKTGFLYSPGSIGDFVASVMFIHSLILRSGSAEFNRIPSAAEPLEWIRHGARVQVQQNFNRAKNLESFGTLFVQKIAAPIKEPHHANLILQQV